MFFSGGIMRAKYIYRMDDITSEMNWEQFWLYINLFKKYNIKPLLGIVPDNHDPDLAIDTANKDFWKIIRDLKEKGIVEIAQHGYQHKLFNASAYDCLGFKNDPRHLTEFTGLPYKEQYEWIKKGQSILRGNGIYTDIWMAPCHSLDIVTLRALKDLGFKYVTDGIAVFPFLFKGLVFVPQQIGRPRWFPVGTHTICLHTNSADSEIYKKVEKHLKSGRNIISFSEAADISFKRAQNILDILFREGYKIAKTFRQLMKKQG